MQSRVVFASLHLGRRKVSDRPIHIVHIRNRHANTWQSVLIEHAWVGTHAHPKVYLRIVRQIKVRLRSHVLPNWVFFTVKFIHIFSFLGTHMDCNERLTHKKNSHIVVLFVLQNRVLTARPE